MNKSAYTIDDQIALLKQRGMLFRDEAQAYERLKNISYYRLKGYWWDMQSDTVRHLFYPGACFDDVMEPDLSISHNKHMDKPSDWRRTVSRRF